MLRRLLNSIDAVAALGAVFLLVALGGDVLQAQGNPPATDGGAPPRGSGGGRSPSAGGDTGLTTPVHEACDADGICRQVVQVCKEDGSCDDVPVEECLEDEDCRHLLDDPASGDLGDADPPCDPALGDCGDFGPGTGFDPGAGDFRPGTDGSGAPVREVCDDDGGDCRQVVDVCDERGQCREVSLDDCQDDEHCRGLLAGSAPDGGTDPPCDPALGACGGFDPGTGGFGPGTGGFGPPVREVCDDDGQDCRQVVDVCDERGRCREVSLDDCRDDERCRGLLAGQPGPDSGPAPEPQGRLGELLDDLQERFEANPNRRVKVDELLEDLDDDRDREFLLRLAGLDGLLTLDELQRVLGGGPLAPGQEPPHLGFFEGVLDGIDLAERLLIIGGQEFQVSEGILVEDSQGRRLDVVALRDLAGSHPRVALELSEDDLVRRLVVLSRVDRLAAPTPGAAEEFFGPVGLIESGKIVLSGPRFQATARTRFVDASNQSVDPASLGIGTLVSVTPGAPDRAAGSQEPTAVRVQVVDPRRPPQARADIITGHLLRTDPAVELDGPRAQLTADTRFTADDGSARSAADVQVGTFVRVVTRAPGFGEEIAVAVEVTVLQGDFAAGPPPRGDGDDGDDEDEGRPAEEIRVEGFVDEVGPDYLVLQGDHLELDARVLVTGIDGRRLGLDGLLPGDLLEIDTRGGGQRGFVVTRIQVIDPAVQTFGRPGVRVGSFEEIDGGDLVLAGPYFQVPSDAEVKGLGGRGAALADLESGQYVRLSASPPRFDRGETLPVAFEVRVSKAPEGFRSPVEGQPPDDNRPSAASSRVVSSFPEEGDVEVPTTTAVEVRFDGNVTGLLFDPSFEFTLFPRPLSFGGLEVSADGRTISAEVELEDGRSYQLVVLSQRTGLYTIRFTTGATIPSASIAGRITLPDELPRHARFVPGESFAVLHAPAEGETLPFPELGRDLPEGFVAAGVPLTGQEFAFANVEPGTYYLIAFLGLDLGRGEFIQLRAVYDADGDGQADPIAVAADGQIAVELGLSLPDPLTVVALTPAPRTAGVPLQAEIQVEFNKLAILAAGDLRIFPPPVATGQLQVSDDGSAYNLGVELEENTVYRVVVERASDADGGQLGEPATTVFTTAPSFASAQTVRGRLVLPDLPAARVFHGPVVVGLVRFAAIGAARFGIEHFDEEDVVASTISFAPEFEIQDVPPGEYAVVAFVRVEVPRGFRPPDPAVRPMADFDLTGRRFNDQVLEVFDTLELFGFSQGADGRPAAVTAGADDALVLLRGNARTRDDRLRVEEFSIEDPDLLDGAAPVLTVVEVTDADGDGRPDLLQLEPSADVSFDSDTDVQIAFRFNRSLRVDRGLVAVEAALDGRRLSRIRVADDGRVVLFTVHLQPGGFHRFTLFKAESRDGARLERPFDVGLSLGDFEALALASVSGQVSLTTLDESGQVLSGDDADVIDEASVYLFQVEGDELRRVGSAVADDDGSYAIDDVVPGPYQVFAELTTASGQELKAVHDGDGDGLADVVDVGADGLTGVDIAATVVVATEEDTETGTIVRTTPPGGNEGATLQLVFACDEGPDCASIQSNVEVGAEVDLDLYVSGATNVNGYAALVRYDADILEFVEALDAPEGRTNFLRTAGGLALFLSPLLREPELEYGGAILGSNDDTAPEGDGFLGRFRFRVTDEFEGAQVFLEQVKLKSTTGQDVLAPGLSAKLAPQVFEEQQKGVVSFDFNTAADDQEEFHKGFVPAGEVVDVDVYLNLDLIGEGFADLSNYSVTVEFDTSQVSFLSYAPETADEANLLLAGGGTVPPLPAIVGETSVTFGAAILGPTAATAPDSSGFIGRLTFATTDAFAETDLLVTAYAVKSVALAQQEVSTIIVARMSSGEVTQVAAGSSTDVSGGGTAGDASGSDFNGDGFVDFTDFFQFADVFGTAATSASAIYDLNSDGQIDFSDFFAFADVFGTAVARPVAEVEAPPFAGRLDLAARSTAEDLVLELRGEGAPLRGYAAVVEFDPARFQLGEASDAASALRGGGQSLLLTRSAPGRIELTGSRTGAAPGVEGLLAELHFTPVAPEATGLFRIAEGTARVADGTLTRVAQLSQVEARWVPRVFALDANYPNPFNPSTTIAFQLPTDSPVRLEVYDVLGQRVRTLVHEERPAGFHRVLWDGRDDGGRAAGAGVYLYRLQAGQFRQVRKLLLVK